MFSMKVSSILLLFCFKKVINVDYERNSTYLNLLHTATSSIPNNEVPTYLEKHYLNTTFHRRNTRSALSRPRHTRNLSYGEVSFDKFMRLEEINNYLRSLAKRFPKIAKIEHLGKSYEGRDILAIRISTGNYNKPTIFIDAGIHGREWIAPPVALYIIHQLVEVTQNSGLFQNVNWAIAPIINPDGYEYTHEKERFWRKTRSKGNTCLGVDINRNFGFHWMATGASNLECSEVYGGPKQFSEVETIILGNYLWNNRDTIKLYVSLHGYGSYILYPWAFTTAVARNQNELHNLGLEVMGAIGRVYGTRYQVGAPSRILYAVAGGSADYAKGVAGIELAYTIELPAGGPYNFDPPTTKIRPTVQETWEGFKVFHKHIQQKYGQG